MKIGSSVRPTAGELEILRILWEQSPATVKEVNDIQNKDKNVGYTTTLKIMQIMTEKNMLKRRADGRSHVYEPVHKQEQMQRHLLDSFMDSAFGGSAVKLVMQALGSHKATAKEIRQIRELLNRMDKGEKP